MDGVTAVLNYDAPKIINAYKWRLTGGMDFTYDKKDVCYTSFIDSSDFELCFHLKKFLLDSRKLEKL